MKCGKEKIGGIMFYLAGDIGGTTTRLALYKSEGLNTLCRKECKYLSRHYLDLKVIVDLFLEGKKIEIRRACFAIAGPVKGGKSHATNLPWLIDAEELADHLHAEQVILINDLEANAYGLSLLPQEEFYVLNKGCDEGKGNSALVSAGTGLGEAGIYFDGKRYHPFASEGGHCDFAPRSQLEEELLSYLREKFAHVSYERILSGPGLYQLYRFLLDTQRERESGALLEDIERAEQQAPLISALGLQGRSTACRRALELFVSIYGAEAGNVALKILAVGGLFIGGGIAPKILEVLKEGGFMKAFIAKGRLTDLLSTIPVKVILNEYTALLGSAYVALHFERI